MAEQLTKQPAKSEQLETYKRLYSAAWEKGFLELMFLMAEQYSMELSVKIEGSKELIPSPTVKFWRESLKDLSPNEMREALRVYMGGERGCFKPNPEELKACVPEGSGSDKPRLLPNPDCPDCEGHGLRIIEVDDLEYEKRYPGRKRTAATRCHCPKVVYAGQRYPFARPQKQLPAPPRTAEEEDRSAKEVFARLQGDPKVGTLVREILGRAK